MRAEKRIIETGKGMRAVRRSPLSSNQPLKPKASAIRAWSLLSVFLLSLGVLVQQNYESLAFYLNRPVVKVHIENQWQQLDHDTVRAAVSPFIGTGFFSFDVSGVKSNLEQDPWIAKASVKRIWPDGVALNITEEVAIARWGESELLNQYGDRFSPSRVVGLSSLPALTGPEESQFEVMEQYQLMSQILYPAGLRITHLKLSARGSWDLVLNESLQVTVGRSHVIDRLERFVGFYAAQPVQDTGEFLAVDLRYGNGIAVKNAGVEFTGVAVR